jgi:hypothetical protein
MAPKRVRLSSRPKAETATSPLNTPRKTTVAGCLSATHAGSSPVDTATLDSFLHCPMPIKEPSEDQEALLHESPLLSSSASSSDSADATCRVHTRREERTSRRVHHHCKSHPSHGSGSEGGRAAHLRSARLTAARNAQYRQNWSQVVLGATSGIMCVLVGCLSYALYVLVIPYYYSITGAVLLSIVMHPQSRLRSVLYMGTAVDRMRRVQLQWSVRGRLAGVVGAWLSLHHFASFVLLQVTFFLGLNKIRVASDSFLLGRDSDVNGKSSTSTTQTSTLKGGEVEEASAAESRASSLPPFMQRTFANGKEVGPAAPTLRKGSSSADQGAHRTDNASTGRPGALHRRTDLAPPPGMLSPLNASIVLSPITATPSALLSTVATAPQHRRLVSTARGRRVLRCLTLTTLVILAHLLLGIAYFALLHVVLALFFAIIVPFLTPETFVTSMSRLWRTAVVVFFIVGLTINLTADVLSISHAVHRTTSAVVSSLGDAVGGAMKGAYGLDSPTPSAVGAASRVPSTASTAAAGRSGQKEDGRTGGREEGNTSFGPDAVVHPRQPRDTLESLVVHQLQSLVVQELANMFSNGKVPEMLDTLASLLPPQLQSIARQGVVDGGSGSWRGGLSQRTTAESNHESGTAAAVPGPSASLQTPRAWAFPWAAVRALGSVNFPKLPVYTTLSNASLPNDTNGRGGTSRKTKGVVSSDVTTGVTVHTDWAKVGRHLVSALRPYVEGVMRLLVWFGFEMMGFFDSIYALMLCVFLFRYLTQLEHTVLYYGIAKLLRVIQPEVGDFHARNIEQDITVSFITLLQSFWHMTWFHFCVTFCAFRMWDFPTPFLLGLMSVVLASFPLLPKWLSPCSVAFVYMVVQLISLTTADGNEDCPFLVFPDGGGLTEGLIFGKPYLFAYARTLSFGLAMLLECTDEWLLCVSRGLRGGFVVDAAGRGREQLPQFVVGTSLVLGFVAYGVRGIVFGPLTVIVAQVLFDNWDIVLASRETRSPPPPPPSLLLADEEEEVQGKASRGQALRQEGRGDGLGPQQ